MSEPFTAEQAARYKKLTDEMLGEIIAKLQRIHDDLGYDTRDGIQKIRNDAARSAYEYAAEIVRTIGGIPA